MGRRDFRREIMRERLRRVRLRMDDTIQCFFQGIRYRLSVSASEHQGALAVARAFAGELLSYLSQDTAARLKPLMLKRGHLDLFNRLFEQANEGGLILRDEKKLTVQGGSHPPYLVQRFVVNPLRDPAIEELSFVLRWLVKEKRPLGFTVFGSVRQGEGMYVDFWVFVGKPDSAEFVWESLKIVEKKGEKVQVVIGRGGNSIILTQETEDRGKRIVRTWPYFRIGCFDGLETRRTYWVYGHNSDKHRSMLEYPLSALERSLMQTALA